jgi:hypothetical protein
MLLLSSLVEQSANSEFGLRGATPQIDSRSIFMANHYLLSHLNSSIEYLEAITKSLLYTMLFKHSMPLPPVMSLQT